MCKVAQCPRYIDNNSQRVGDRKEIQTTSVNKDPVFQETSDNSWNEGKKIQKGLVK